MEYYIFSYAIDVGEVKQVFGSKDATLFENIQNEEVFRHYSAQSTDNYVSLENALHQIIYDETYRKRSESTYWYAFIAICSYFSKQLPFDQDIQLGEETDLIDDFIQKDFDIDITLVALLLDDFPETNLPTITYLPMVGFISDAKIESIATTMNEIDINEIDIKNLLSTNNDRDERKALIYEYIKGIQSNINFCYTHNLSLISFCH